jgi:hypothetical protein
MRPALVLLLTLACAACDVAPPSSADRTTGPSAAPSAGPSAKASGTAMAATPPVAAPPAAPPQPTTAPAAPPPPPPASVAKVTVLPGPSGPLGSAWLFQLTGFPPGRVNETITDPRGIPKNALLTVGPDGSASATFQTSVNDQPGAGRYQFRFESGSISLTTSIDVTRP